jgi:hypothetical protein
MKLILVELRTPKTLTGIESKIHECAQSEQHEQHSYSMGRNRVGEISVTVPVPAFSQGLVAGCEKIIYYFFSHDWSE